MGANKKIAINSLIIFGRLCIVSAITLILSRVVLDALGASDYGLYSVVGGIVLLLNVINSAMTTTTYRFLAFEIGKEESNACKIFNTSAAIHLCFALLILILGIPIGEWYISNYLNVSPDKLGDAHFVFHISIITAAINTISVPYQGLLVAYEKFSATALIDIITNVVKLIIIFLFIYSDTNRLQLYSIIMGSCMLFQSILYFAYCKKKHAEVLILDLSKDIALYKQMLSFSGWTMFGAAANVGKTQGSSVILNLFFGTVVNASYAIANQLETFILMFSRTLNSSVVPQTTKSYSAGDQERAIQLSSHISKYTFFLMSMAAFPVLIETEFLLGIWLKEIPDYSVVFSQLIILGGLLGCLGEGIPNLINASGKIKAYQIVVHTILLSGLPISFFLFKQGANPYAIAIVYCFIGFFNSFVKLGMVYRVVKFNIRTFLMTSHLRIFLVSIPLIIYACFRPHWEGILGHLSSFALAEIVLLMSIYIFGLSQGERNTLIQFVKSKIR